MKAVFSKVLNRGIPPESFIAELIAWGKSEDKSIFAPNDNPVDIYSLVVGTLGPWEGPLHRRAAMLEVMRVHAGFESSWNWKEGVDKSNRTSMGNITGEETGIFQVSWDSTQIEGKAMLPFARASGIEVPSNFIAEMKANHTLALRYYARLVRVSIAWAGPLKRREVLPWLSRDAVKEFESALD